MSIGTIIKSRRISDIYMLILTVGIILFINILSQQYFFRLDLTQEKRYTLSQETKEIVSGLDDVVFIRVYLDGELNISFKKFQKSINDLLDELRVYGRDKVQYEFVNPLDGISKDKEGKIIQDLYDRGLKPTNIHQRDKEGGISEKIIFPSAIITYKNIEIPVNFLYNDPGQNAEQNLNNSIEGLEYSIISLVSNITSKRNEKIVFIEGHGELNELEVNDISVELSKYYQIDRGIINGQLGVLDSYKAVIIAKPDKPFSEPDKFVIDQYIMKGGRVLWLIDAVQASLDSLVNGTTIAMIPQLNLDDMLFRYGVRVVPVLLQDIQSNAIPVNVALHGNSPNFQPVPWLYYPLIPPYKGHAVTQNLNMVLCRFANTLDTIEARKDIHKTPLLISSPISRTIIVPAIISLDEVRKVPKKEDFNASNQLVGTLLEGSFESVFKNRGISAYFNPTPSVIEKSVPTRMAVIADGDIIRNDVRYTAKGPAISMLGYDRFTRQTFGNKEFLVNLIQYLANDNNLLKLRGREFKIRLLDKEKISSQKTEWILINMIVPSVIVLVFGFVFYFLRKNKYSKK
jgi:ABC-2 type transport system permease protein